ncbi:MAG: hypothetical protein LW693_05650 [Saprospiraceae bacterium]|jgi:hypothetical protein|nr:hypothetical protein [Saprospiraceae bacterium]
MKLRLDEHSVRLRLGKSDITALESRGSVKTTTVLPGGYLQYGIETRTNIEKPECILSGSVLSVLLPAAQTERWIKSDDVGIYASVTVGNDGNKVQIILEKDFPCKHDDAEKQSDRFDDLANQQKIR